MDLKTRARYCLLLGVTLIPLCVHGQLTKSDFERALDLAEHYRGLVDHLPSTAEWIDGTSRFVYRETLRAKQGEKETGARFVMVDAIAGTSQAAFDQQRLAETLTKESGERIEGEHLPFTRFHFEDDQKSIAFDMKEAHWTCHLAAYTCTKKTESRDPDDDKKYCSTFN